MKIYKTKESNGFFRCSLSLLVCHKARNTIDENIFHLCGVQTLSTLVGTVRLELMTSCMSSMRSNQLSYAPAFQLYNNIIFRRVLSNKIARFCRENYFFRGRVAGKGRRA